MLFSTLFLRLLPILNIPTQTQALTPHEQSLAAQAYAIDPLDPSDREPWPNNGAIYWCENDSNDYQTAHELIESAYQIWAQAGLGPATPDSPSLLYAGEPCERIEKREPWLFANVLQVEIDWVGGEMSADVGFVLGGRNRLVLAGVGPGVKAVVPKEVAVAHELGHLWGLHHQHQRPEIWDKELIALNASNLRYYDDFKRRGHNMSLISHERGAAVEAGYQEPLELLPFEHCDHDPPSNTSVDWNSIMLYGSTHYGGHEDPEFDANWEGHWVYKEADVLLRQDHGYPEHIDQPQKPSKADVAKLRELYPGPWPYDG
ncbi:hypothetical protein MBLNU230_g7952t1 [Neophaeotheca triangularis]